MIFIEDKLLLPFGAAAVLPKKVLKSWGYELIFYNKQNYCSKKLFINKNSESSMHYHNTKHETITVYNGILELEYLDEGAKKVVKLYENHSIVIPPGFSHRLRAKETDVILFEASTHALNSDSIRLTEY